MLSDIRINYGHSSTVIIQGRLDGDTLVDAGISAITVG
jgi:hypothetical protein